jgi:cytoskeletal protein CcmA (bactofilin family)
MKSKKELKQQRDAIKKARAGKISTIIGQGDIVEGKITISNSIRVDGEFSGEIHCNGLVIISETAVVKGKIISIEVIIAGRVEGEVETMGTLELEPTCFLKGDIKVKNLVVHEGAIFLGQTSMEVLEDAKEPSKLASKGKDKEADLEPKPENKDEVRIAPDIKKF